MKRTIVYIDGHNLYYRLLRGTGDKWLDLYAFSKGLLNADHEIVGNRLVLLVPRKTNRLPIPLHF